MTKRIVVILYGPPGAGKGTQANLLADTVGLLHFDTGKFLEATVHNPKLQKNKFIARERKAFDSGKLLTPSWVLSVVERKVKEISVSGLGLVFSGSPRTLHEAENLMPVLSKLYGKENIYTFVLAIPPAESIKRNSARLICKICGSPLLTAFYPSKRTKHCPHCGGALYRRTLDNPTTIKVRLHEYAKRTEPIFDLLRKKKYRVIDIDGKPAPYKIFQTLYDRLKDA